MGWPLSWASTVLPVRNWLVVCCWFLPTSEIVMCKYEKEELVKGGGDALCYFSSEDTNFGDDLYGTVGVSDYRR